MTNQDYNKISKGILPFIYDLSIENYIWYKHIPKLLVDHSDLFCETILKTFTQGLINQITTEHVFKYPRSNKALVKYLELNEKQLFSDNPARDKKIVNKFISLFYSIDPSFLKVGLTFGVQQSFVFGCSDSTSKQKLEFFALGLGQALNKKFGENYIDLNPEL